jgi:hypothetical protein
MSDVPARRCYFCGGNTTFKLRSTTDVFAILNSDRDAVEHEIEPDRQQRVTRDARIGETEVVTRPFGAWRCHSRCVERRRHADVLESWATDRSKAVDALESCFLCGAAPEPLDPSNVALVLGEGDDAGEYERVMAWLCHSACFASARHPRVRVDSDQIPPVEP